MASGLRGVGGGSASLRRPLSAEQVGRARSGRGLVPTRFGGSVYRDGHGNRLARAWASSIIPPLRLRRSRVSWADASSEGEQSRTGTTRRGGMTKQTAVQRDRSRPASRRRAITARRVLAGAPLRYPICARGSSIMGAQRWPIAVGRRNLVGRTQPGRLSVLDLPSMLRLFWATHCMMCNLQRIAPCSFRLRRRPTTLG